MLLCGYARPVLPFLLQAEAASKGLTEGEVLQQAVLREAVMYGEMVQAVYDTLLTNDVYSPYFGNCVPGLMQPKKKLGETVQNYTQLGEEAKQYTVRWCIGSSCCMAPKPSCSKNGSATGPGQV